MQAKRDLTCSGGKTCTAANSMSMDAQRWCANLRRSKLIAEACSSNNGICIHGLVVHLAPHRTIPHPFKKGLVFITLRLERVLN